MSDNVHEYPDLFICSKLISQGSPTGDSGLGMIKRTAHGMPARKVYGWAIFCALEACAVTIFWAFDALPFMDLPAHAGIFALQNRFDPAGFEGRFFVFAPHLGPYSLFRELGRLCTSLFGALAAVRILATLPVILIPLATLYASVRLFGRANLLTAFVALMMALGYMTVAGFASYLIAIAVLLVALTEWLVLVGHAEGGKIKQLGFTVVALLAMATFIAHGFAFILLLFAAAVTIALSSRRWSSIWCLAVFLPASIVAAYSYLTERMINPGVEGTQELQFKFQGAFDKFTLLITPALMTRTGIDALICVLLWLIIPLWSVATLRSIMRTGSPADTPRLYARDLAWIAASLFVAFLLLPHSVGWFGFVDARLLPVILLLLLIMIDDKVLGQRWQVAVSMTAGVSAAVMVSLALLASHLFQDESKGYREVLAEVPAFARLLNMPSNADSRIFVSHPFVHYNKLVLVDRPVVTSDIWFHQGTAIYPTSDNPSLRLPPEYSSSNLHEVDWSKYALDDWDYVLIRTEPLKNAPSTPAQLRLIKQAGGWWLFHNAPAK